MTRIITQRSMAQCTIQVVDFEDGGAEPFGWGCVAHAAGKSTATEDEAREGARRHIEEIAQGGS